MKFLVLLALVCAVSAYRLPEDLVKEQFHKFQKDFGKVYGSDGEESARLAIFAHNYYFIDNHNKEADNGVHTYRLAVNQFADLTNEEFVHKMNGLKASLKTRHNITYRYSHDLPATVDWRTKGVVTPVKNQAQCGSCWAFSTVASLEGQHALATKNLVSLSEQNLVDCSTAEGNMGCEGGLMDQGFEYIIKNKGIDTEASYPYKAVDEKCVFKPKSVGATLTGFTDVQTGSESQLQAAVASVGPISVAIDASSMSFQFYSSGVYDDTQCGNQRANLDHGVTAVGYGTQDGKDYWLVKNSWDVTWGQKGYILMSRNKDNQCGISTLASYPTGAH